MRLQFAAPDFYRATASKFTGRLELRRAIQSRTLRNEHVDAHYNNALWLAVRDWVMSLRELLGASTSSMLLVCSLDDKCKIPIGEPGMPVSTKVVRKHNTGAITHTSNGTKRPAADHDCQSKSNMTPSVSLIMEPKGGHHAACGGAWYNGELHVALKDAAFQRSGAFRHVAELASLLLGKFAPGKWRSGGEVPLARALYEQRENIPPFVVVRTDGGSDHNPAFSQVQMSLVSLFLAADMDMLVAVRTAPVGIRT